MTTCNEIERPFFYGGLKYKDHYILYMSLWVTVCFLPQDEVNQFEWEAIIADEAHKIKVNSLETSADC